MNPLRKELTTGTVGELLVQLRLLQHGIQAAPPLKDTGNDLIAIREDVFKAIQVKTSARGVFKKLDELPERYHLVALVHLVGEADKLLLDESQIYLVTKDWIGHRTQVTESKLAKHLLAQVADELFSE